MNKLLPLVAFSVLLLVPAGAQNAFAIPFGGIEFPDGAVSFADAVITYDNLFLPGPGGPPPTDPNFLDPLDSLGIPNYAAPFGSVSLGNGGLLEVEFVDNVLTNSGSAALDLHIFEIGPDIEDTFVSVRPTAATAALLAPCATCDLGVPGYPATIGDGFYEIGKVLGSTSSIDIDSFFPAAAGTYAFDAVQLIDDPNEGGMAPAGTVGADIDAVGAITSMAPPPEIIGGEIIPIESASLILAGAQSYSWMIALAVSILALGLFVASRKFENS